MSLRNLSIKKKIIFASVGITLAWFIAIVLVTYMGPTSALTESQRTTFSTDNDVFHNLLDNDAQSLAKVLSALTRDQKLVSPFMAKERQNLLDASLPIFNELKSKYDITHMYFIDKEGYVYLRTHNPPKHGDKLKRATFLQAQSNGLLGKGIEMGKSFFSLRVVMPVRINGQIEGYMELGEELDHLVKDFVETTGAQISMWLSDRYVNTNKLSKDFPEIDGWRMVMASNDSEQKSVMHSYLSGSANKGNKLVRMHKNSKPVGIMAFPFEDAFKANAGIVVFSRDLSALDEAISGFNWNIGVLASILLLFSVTIGMVIARQIAGQIDIGQKAVSAIAKGNLDTVISVKSNDELGMLLKGVSGMTEQLKDVVSKVRSGTHSIASGVAEISAGNDNLSQRTEEQGASIEEMASSMEQMLTTVKQNAENAGIANKKVSEAKDLAIEGGNVVSEAIEAMQAINDSSRKIVDIITVIDDIAFQTNLLALNAAVEAARAGEQGRGFAVVAGEVRTLAQRSAEAAKEIKSLINDSTIKVEAGSELVNKSGSTLQSIVDSVKDVSTVVSEINAASMEQASGIEQVNSSVTQIDTMTQQNAALVEEAAAAARAMRDQANDLTELVAFFQFSGIQSNHKYSRRDISSNNTNKSHNENRKSATNVNPNNSIKKDIAINSAAKQATGTYSDEWQDF